MRAGHRRVAFGHGSPVFCPYCGHELETFNDEQPSRCRECWIAIKVVGASLAVEDMP